MLIGAVVISELGTFVVISHRCYFYHVLCAFNVTSELLQEKDTKHKDEILQLKLEHDKKVHDLIFFIYFVFLC